MDCKERFNSSLRTDWNGAAGRPRYDGGVLRIGNDKKGADRPTNHGFEAAHSNFGSTDVRRVVKKVGS